MASAQILLDVLAWTKALFEATKASVDLVATYTKYRNDRATIREAQISKQRKLHAAAIRWNEQVVP